MTAAYLDYQSLKDIVYKYISDEINAGRLLSGDKISEQAISNALCISRTPVREALIQLAAEGILVNEPRKGFKVKDMSEAVAKELYAVIGRLDAFAASLAVAHIDSKDLALMERLYSDMEKAILAGEYDHYYQLQLDFHDVYSSKCQNSELLTMLERLKKRFVKQGFFGENSRDLTEIYLSTNLEHKHITELFFQRKGEELERYLIHTHWRDAFAGLDSLEEKNNE